MSKEEIAVEDRTEDRRRAAHEAAFVHTRIDLALLEAAVLAANFGVTFDDFVEGAAGAYEAMKLKLETRQAELLGDAVGG
jgi:hypothetical protein